MDTTQCHRQDEDALNADYLHSAFVIDANGKEIRITRDMITESCNQLASQEASKSSWIPTKLN